MCRHIIGWCLPQPLRFSSEYYLQHSQVSFLENMHENHHLFVIRSTRPTKQIYVFKTTTTICARNVSSRVREKKTEECSRRESENVNQLVFLQTCNSNILLLEYQGQMASYKQSKITNSGKYPLKYPILSSLRSDVLSGLTPSPKEEEAR